jgi:hypothetical protein
MLKKYSIWLLPLLLLLVGCSGKVYDRAYTASGQGQQESEMTADEQFSPRDDLNVVIKLNRHDDPVDITVRFTDPNGDLLQEIEGTASDDVGTVVMGVDFEGRSDVGNEWIIGRYEVDILVDGEEVDRLFFRVD